MSDLYPTLSLGEKTPVPNDLDENIVVAPLQPLSVWSNQAGANIEDPITKSLGYANYQRGHYFRTGQLNDALESSITQGLVSSLLEQGLIDAEQANSEELLRTIQPDPDIQTKTNLIRMAYGEQAGSTWLENQSSGSGNQKELDNQLNSAKTLLVDSGLLSFARVSDEKGNNKVIGGVNITDRGKALDDSVRLGALNYSDAYRVMSGLKKEQDAKTNFEIIREAQILSELNNVLGSDDRSGEVSQNALDVMRGLVKAKDLDPSANQQSDVLAVVGDIRKGLSAAYASKNGFGEGAALQRYSDKEIKDAIELLAANEVNERGEFNFYEDDNTKNIRILGSGHVLAHPNLMQQKDVFERAIESDDRLSPSQLKSLRNQRKLFRELTYDQYNQFLSDSAATSNNWMAAKQAGKVKNLSDTDILDEFLADRRNYSSIKNRLGDVVATVPDAVIGLFASLGAVIFKSEGATKYLVDNQRARQRRRDIASVFGDDFGWGMDLSNVVAPMVVDVSATALLSAGTLGLGGVAYASTKAGVTSTAKALAKNLTKAVTGRQFGDTAKDLALKKQVQKKVNDSVDVAASEGVQEAIKQYNKAVANGVFRKAAPFPSLFLTAANRSAGNTYATIYDAQPDNLTHEEKHDAALGYALLSGTTTGLITSAFMGVGLGGFEQAFLRGMTYKGMSAGMSKILNLDVRGLTSTKVKEAIRVSIEKQLKQAAKKSRFIRQFGIPAASEAAEEGIDEFIQTFIMDAALNEDTPMIDRVMTGLHAASIGGVMGGGVVGVQSMMDKGRGARYEKFQEDTIDNIISDLEGSSPLTQQFLRDNREEITRQLRTASRAREPITTSVSDVDVDMITDRYNEYLSGQISQKEFEERTNSTLKEAEGFVDGVEVSQAKELLIQDIDKELAQKKITEQDSDLIVKESQQRETQAGGLSQETEEELEIKRQQEIKREEEFIAEFDTVWGTKELSEELGEGQTAEQHYDRYIEARRDAETVASFFGMEVRVDRNKKNKFLGAYRAVGTKQGMVLVINPFGLARLTMGLNKSNAQHVARFEAFHEVIHHASWRNLSKAEIDVIFETFDVDQINEIVNLYYNTDQKKAASRQRLGPTSLSSQRISEQHVIVDEFLRMKAQRILKGYTTEEEIEFYKSNPNFVRVLLRYLRSYVNRFKAARELDKDNPVVSAAVNRLTGEMARLKGGFDIDPVVRFDVDDPEKSLDKLIEFLDDAPSISRDPSRKIDMGVRQTQEGSFEYRGAHTAPDRGYGSPMSAMDESIYPSDFYSSDGLRLYGTGSSYDTISDQKVYNQIVSVRGKPEAKVIVYRGVPNNIQGAVINAGDWVTTDIRYAELHGARMHGDEGFKILRKEVKAGELFTEGNSIYEFGYSPSTDIRETQAGSLEEEEEKGIYRNIERVPPITSQVDESQVASLDPEKIKTASDLNDPAEQKIFQKAIGNRNKDRSGILAVAASRLFEKQITQATYNEIRNKVFPYKNVGQVPKAPNAEDIKNVWRTKESTPTKPVYSSKVKAGGSTKFGAISYNDAFEQLQNQKVSVRLDIPTFNKTIREKGAPVYAVTIMGPSMEGALAYTGYAKIKLDSIERKVGSATKIATGAGKFVMASTEGELMEFNPEDLNAFRKDWASGKVGPKKTDKDRWVEVAVNPLRSSEFVDVTNPLDPVPVINGSTAIHVGNRVFVQQPVWGKRPDYGVEEDVRFTQAGGIESGSFDTDEGGIEYGSYPPLFELPFLATGKYQRKKEGIFGRFLNKFTGDVDIRVKRLLEQRKQIQEAVGDDFLKFKAQLDLIIKEDFGGKAPVELIQILTGSRENITPETDQEYADDLVNAGASTEDQIKKVRAAYVARKKKEFRDKKKQAITELGKLQNVPEKDSNNTRLVKHLLGDGLDLSDSNKKVLGLRDLTDQISGVIRDIVGADSEIGIAIDDNMEMYLHKTYRLFTDKEYRDSIRKDEKYENVRATAGAFLLKQYKTLNKEWESDMVDRGLDPDKKTDVQAFKEALVNDYLDIHLSEKRETSNLFQSLRTHTKGVVSLNADVLKKRKNPPKELRDLLGESEDTTGFDTLLETFQHIGLIAAHANFLRNLKKFGTSSTLLSGDPFLIEKKEGQEAPEGFSLLYENNESNKNPEGNPVVNAPFKDGKSYYVLTELKEALEAILSPEAKVKETEAKKAQEFMTKVGSRLTGLSLGAKTLGSIGFYVRNILSNVLFFGPSQGFWGMNKMLGSFGKEFMRKKYLSMTPQEVSAFHRTLIALGVIGNEIESRLIQDFLTNPRSEEQFQNELLSELDKIKAQEKVENKDFLDDSLEKLSGSKIAKSSKFLGRRLRELSQTVDSFYKIAYFMNELEVLQQARAKHNTQGGINYAEMSDQKLMDLAAQKVKRTAQSYDQAPPFVQNLQDTWFGVMFAPFIRFKLEVPRIMINTVRLAKEEMSDSNPVIRKRGKKRLQSFTGVLVGFSALAPVIVNTLSGIGDDEDEALRDSMPEYLRTHSFFYVPLTGNKDDLYSMDLTYLNPYAMMVDPFLRAFEQIWRGSPSQAGGAFAKAMIADQYLDQQILAGAVTSAISNRDPETGKPIREVNDTSFESLYKTFSFVFAESLMPRTPEKIYKEGFVKLMEGDPDMTDFILTPLGAVAKEFLPLKPFRVQPERSLDRFLSERAAEYRRSSSIKGRMYTDDSLSEGFIQKLADTDVERRRRINEHLIKTFRGYRKLGLTNQQIYSQAMEKGYGKRRMALLLNGLMERPSLTKPFINNMVRKGDTHIERLRTYQNQLNTYGRYIPVE